MVHALGGKVRPAEKREYGHAKVELLNGSRLFEGLPKVMAVWMSHGDEAVELPAGFRLIAKSPSAVAAIENPQRKMWAVDRKSTRLNSSHANISYAVFCLKKKK